MDSCCVCADQNKFNALSDDVQPTVLDEPEVSDTEGVIDALEFDLSRDHEKAASVAGTSQTHNWKAEIEVVWFREGLS